MIRAAEAYALGYTGKGVTVGYLDAGIAASHPELSSAIVGGFDFNAGTPYAAGSLMVVSTGNESQPHPDLLAGAPYWFPELRDNWLAVTALDGDGDLAPYANRCGVAAGWCLAAPGGATNQASIPSTPKEATPT